jgi:hypothetical protein
MLEDLASHAEVSETIQSDWWRISGEFTWPKADGEQRGPMRLGIRFEGEAVFAALNDLLLDRPEVGRVWSPASIEGMLEAAVAAIVLGDISADVAGIRLDALITELPPDRLVVLPVSGIDVKTPAEVGGVLLTTGLKALGTQMRIGAEALQRLARELPRSGELTLIATTCRADGDVAAAVARRRFRAVLPLLALCCAESEFAWWAEIDVSFGVSATTVALTVVAEDVGRSVIAGGERPAVPVDGQRIADQFARRPALARIAALAARLPTEPTNKFERRLLRASLRLGEAFEGNLADRFLRRWMAMEALLGERGPELSDRLVERMTVISHPDPSARVGRKAGLKELYGYRSALAHGAEDPPITEHTAAWFRMLAMHTLEVAAGIPAIDEADFFATVDRAKFEAGVFQANPSADS